MSICNRNRIMTWVKFLFRVTLRRPTLGRRSTTSASRRTFSAMSRRTRRAACSRSRAASRCAYGCGLRAGEVVRLKVKHIDSAQKIIRVEQSKGRKDRNVMLVADKMLDLLRQWWKVRPPRHDAGTPPEERL